MRLTQRKGSRGAPAHLPQIMGDDNALERAALLSVHLVVITQGDPMLVHELLHALLPGICPPGLVLQALDQHKRALEKGMRSDELSQLGN